MNNQDKHGPIGIFDSGYGGLTILKEIIKELPEYDYIYIGDNARTPYGTRSFDLVYNYTLEAVKEFFKRGCPLVILACNTASAKALRNIQQFNLPVIAPNNRILGVIRPSVENIKNYTKNGHIGIFATNGTVESLSYPLEIKKLHNDRSYVITQQACPMWVPLIENNETENEGADFFVKKYIIELLAKDPLIDTIILACTHYPIIKNKIKKNLPKNIKIVEQGSIVALSLKDYLLRHKEIETRLEKKSQTKYLTTESPYMFQKIASLFLSKEIVVEHVEFEDILTSKK